MAKAKAKAKPEPAKEPKAAPVEAPKVYAYTCPACTKVAIETSNKMMGVKVVCQACGKEIMLDNAENYKKI